MARQAFELHGKVEQPLYLLVTPVFLTQFGNPAQRTFQIPRIGRVVRYLLAQPVDLAIAHLQHAARVAQNRACLQLSEGNDLRDLPAAVFLLHVTDHLAAPRFAEVDIEVRHRHTVGVEESFEQQAEPDRVEIGNR